MEDNHQPTRRDFLSVCTGSFAAVGGTLAAWPLFAQAAPNPATPSPSVLVDLTPIRPGQAITVYGEPNRSSSGIARASKWILRAMFRSMT